MDHASIVLTTDVVLCGCGDKAFLGVPGVDVNVASGAGDTALMCVTGNGPCKCDTGVSLSFDFVRSHIMLWFDLAGFGFGTLTPPWRVAPAVRMMLGLCVGRG